MTLTAQRDLSVGTIEDRIKCLMDIFHDHDEETKESLRPHIEFYATRYEKITGRKYVYNHGSHRRHTENGHTMD